MEDVRTVACVLVAAPGVEHVQPDDRQATHPQGKVGVAGRVCTISRVALPCARWGVGQRLVPAARTQAVGDGQERWKKADQQKVEDGHLEW